MSRVLKVGVDDVRAYFTDGRRVSFLLERRIAYEVVKGRLAPSEGAGFDLIDSAGRKWEVRSITSGGVYFCPSYMVGSGRQFDEPGFLRKLDEIEGYIVSDVEQFPNIPFWIIPKTTVLGWYNNDQLGAGTKISRARALGLLR
ncbi:MAG: hypothetical protein A3F74_20710 [Betaproteobacteria bacterium RIFCSPLOWO2_12_FULL_62_58]|nr:MAG: hypothetical protein A3F74_20710 [Betaproteobacteria bacterium RIFCSPLOWO2_12_FULL_62_58]